MNTQNPKQYREAVGKMPSLTGQVTVCLTCGLDMADIHLLHLLDREQGMVNNRTALVVVVGLEKSIILLAGQVDFHSGQGSFHSHLPDEKGIIFELNLNKRANYDLHRANKL